MPRWPSEKKKNLFFVFLWYLVCGTFFFSLILNSCIDEGCLEVLEEDIQGYTERNGVVGDRGGGRRRVSGPRAQTDIFPTIFGHTDLKIGSSRAKNCEELDVKVGLPVDLPKLAQKGQN